MGKNLMASENENKSTGGCGPWGETQNWAVVWFVSAIFLGASLTYFFSNLDFFMYNSNAEVLDFKKYRENRTAFSSIPTDSIDARSLGNLKTAVEN
jgi:hypothetical protein